MDNLDLEKLTLPVASKPVTTDRKALPRHKTGGKFLKGPIPWDWLSMAASLPGKALHVAIALWFHAGIKQERTVTLSGTVLKNMGVKRNSAYRGVAALEEFGLISTIRQCGRSPIVTILEVKRSLNHEKENL